MEITRANIEKLLAERIFNGRPDPVTVMKWEPFTLSSKEENWIGSGIPARMILADVLLDEAKRQENLIGLQAIAEMLKDGPKET